MAGEAITSGKKKAKISASERNWLEIEVKPVKPELIELARVAVERELASRDALNQRLMALVTFAGSLLALALALGEKAGTVAARHHTRHVVFQVGFTTAVVLLAGAIVLAIGSLRPEPRHRTNPDLLKHYAIEGTDLPEVLIDTYKTEVALAEQLAPGNTSRATSLLWARRATGLALVIAAAEAVIVLL